jgi:hypothetical protein
MTLASIVFCLGLAGTSHKGWEIVLWLILVTLFMAKGTNEMVRAKKGQAHSALPAGERVIFSLQETLIRA